MAAALGPRAAVGALAPLAGPRAPRVAQQALRAAALGWERPAGLAPPEAPAVEPGGPAGPQRVSMTPRPPPSIAQTSATPPPSVMTATAAPSLPRGLACARSAMPTHAPESTKGYTTA